MPEQNQSLRVPTVFDFSPEDNTQYLYQEITRNILRKVLPHYDFKQRIHDPDLIEDLREQLHSQLPILTCTPCQQAPSNISFYLLAKHRANSFKFFFEMISKWLVPEKRLNVVLVYAADFRISLLNPEDLYTVSEVMIRVEDQQELEEVQRNFPIIESESRLGVESAYYARKILEVRGLTADEKTVFIQEHITSLMHRLPKHFDQDVFTEMQHVFLICTDNFKAARNSTHLSRIISVQYLFRRALREALKVMPENRHLFVKLFKGKLRTNEESKNVLGMIVAVNFLKEKEVFEERHILKAVKSYVPSAKCVENSFFANKRGSESICTIYLELEKEHGEEFTSDEIRLLKKELPYDLKDRIEHLLHPVFMPSNEEEIMRNILSLSNQIKYLRDLAQVFISFDEQTHSHLFFKVIMVRVVRPGCNSVQELFGNSGTLLEYLPDRCKMVGMLRKKYAKEATVFRVKFSNEAFMRADNSIDLSKARQVVASELTHIIGEYRDFNGGMISKQNELLCTVRELLHDESIKYNDLLLENFFYSLHPVAMRTVLPAQTLKNLFVMLLESIDQNLFNGKPFTSLIRKDNGFVYAMFTLKDKALKEELSRLVNKFPNTPTDLATSHSQVYDVPSIGYIYRCDSPFRQQAFIQAIQDITTKWEAGLHAKSYT